MQASKSALATQIESEIKDYFTRTVSISEGVDFSQKELVRRIGLFENHTYPTGKIDSQGNYKYWFTIIDPRVAAEIKNIDFDTKDITAYSERKIDLLPCLITNLKIKEYLRETGQAEEINSAIEQGSGWGNVVWKKVKRGYERADLRNFYVINQTAETLKGSPVIERHQFSQSDLRAKSEVYKNVAEVLKDCKADSYSSTAETPSNDTTTPYYEIFERNGEVCLKDLKEYNGEKIQDGDSEKYVFAKVIAAGVKGDGSGSVDIKYILFAQELKGKTNADLYKEYHRGRYKGRWFREGLIELLFDLQVRANQIGNQLAQGLEWASKVIFTGDDVQIVQNVLTDLKNGDYLKSKDLRQVEVRLQGFDQLANEWNRIIALANEIANSQEVVQGITPASGTPLGTTQLLNQNSNKLFDFIREKLAIPLSEIFEEWIIPDLIKELKAKEVIRLMGDSDLMDRLMRTLVDAWYIDNLLVIGPHDEAFAENLKEEKLDELKNRPELLMQGITDMFESFKPSVSVIITGEQASLNADLDTLIAFANLEQDPVRRQAIIELGARKKGLDFGSLPKTPVQPEQPVNAAGGAIAPNKAVPAKVGTEAAA